MDVFNQSYQLRLKRESQLCGDNNFQGIKDEYVKVFSQIKGIRMALSNLGCTEVRNKQTGEVNLGAMVINVQRQLNMLMEIWSEH